MTPGSIARRYGRALFELAKEAGVIDEIGKAVADLALIVEGLEPGSLSAGTIALVNRQQLAATMASSHGKGSLLGRFLGVLANNDRLDQLPGIHRSFERLQDQAAGRVRARVRSASPLSDPERASLRQKLETITGRLVLDTVETDPELLGGVSIEAEGRVYDGSVRTQLTRLERRMAG